MELRSKGNEPRESPEVPSSLSCFTDTLVLVMSQCVCKHLPVHLWHSWALWAWSRHLQMGPLRHALISSFLVGFCFRDAEDCFSDPTACFLLARVGAQITSI